MSVVEQENNNPSLNPENTVREELVQTAIKFLVNPKVINTSLAQKQNFLRRKGLTDEEIQIACEKSGAYTFHENQNRELPPPVPSQNLICRSNYGQLQYKSFFDKFKDIVHNIAILGAIAYAIYVFYKKFIEPFLFGKKREIEEQIEDLEKSVQSSVSELRDNLASVKVEVERISQNTESNTHRHLIELKSEIASVKGLLLSRKQFPPVSHSPVVPPSIPAWQLSSVQADPNEVNDTKSEDLMEMGSGSGSEPEHDTKKSDSSLEIIGGVGDQL